MRSAPLSRTGVPNSLGDGLGYIGVRVLESYGCPSAWIHSVDESTYTERDLKTRAQHPSPRVSNAQNRPHIPPSTSLVYRSTTRSIYLQTLAVSCHVISDITPCRAREYPTYGTMQSQTPARGHDIRHVVVAVPVRAKTRDATRQFASSVSTPPSLTHAHVRQAVLLV